MVKSCKSLSLSLPLLLLLLGSVTSACQWKFLNLLRIVFFPLIKNLKAIHKSGDLQYIWHWIRPIDWLSIAFSICPFTYSYLIPIKLRTFLCWICFLHWFKQLLEKSRLHVRYRNMVAVNELIEFLYLLLYIFFI